MTWPKKKIPFFLFLPHPLPLLALVSYLYVHLSNLVKAQWGRNKPNRSRNSVYTVCATQGFMSNYEVSGCLDFSYLSAMAFQNLTAISLWSKMEKLIWIENYASVELINYITRLVGLSTIQIHISYWAWFDAATVKLRNYEEFFSSQEWTLPPYEFQN